MPVLVEGGGIERICTTSEALDVYVVYTESNLHQNATKFLAVRTFSNQRKVMQGSYAFYIKPIMHVK